MMVDRPGVDAVLGPIVEKVGSRLPITGGLGLMALGLLVLGLLPSTAPLWLLSALMVLIGLGGPLVMPPTIAVLLNSVPSHRQALQVASSTPADKSAARSRSPSSVLWWLIPSSFMDGLQVSLLIASAVLMAATLATTQLPRMRPRKLTTPPTATT